MMRYINLLLTALAVLLGAADAVAQFDPANPPNPPAPPVQTTYGTLTLLSEPPGACTFNRSATSQVALGSYVDVQATAATGFYFQGWYRNDMLFSSSSGTRILFDGPTTLVARYGYAPSNPDNPPVLDAGPKRYSQVFTEVKPDGAGTVSPTSGNSYLVGSQVKLSASANSNFVFRCWTDRQGHVLSTSSSISCIAQDSASYFTANFDYVPAAPGNPGPPALQTKYPLTLTAQPAAGGYFNISSGNSYTAGSKVSITAYTNTDFQFVKWMNGEQTLSTSPSITISMPDSATHLSAQYAYVPNNPNNPATPAGAYYGFFGQSMDVAPEQTVMFPIFFENSQPARGTVIDISCPQGVRIDTAAVAKGLRCARHQMSIADLGDNAYRISLMADTALTGVNGLMLDVPLTVEAARRYLKTYPVLLSHGVVYLMSGSVIPANVHSGSLRIADMPDAPTVTMTDECTLHSSAADNNQWYRDGVALEGATARDYTPVQTGSYSVSTRNASYESEPSLEYFVDLDNSTGVDMALAEGWNWVSSSLADERLQRPYRFFAQLLRSLVSVRTADRVSECFGGELSAGIDTVHVAAYKLQMLEGAQLTVRGALVPVDSVEVSLAKGWNWIPYVPAVELSVARALERLTPTEGDVIKSQTEFALYHNGNWMGSLAAMRPGYGYMYYANKPAKFYYSQAVTDAVPQRSEAEAGSRWSVNHNRFADNMTMVVRPMIDGNTSADNRFTVGAFCRGECRGVAHSADDVYYMTVHGQVGDSITFRAIDMNGKEYYTAMSVPFTDVHSGTPTSPNTFVIAVDTGVSEVAADSDHKVRIDGNRLILNATDIRSVQLFTAAGQSVLYRRQAPDSIDISQLSPGVYIVVLDTQTGLRHRRVVIR